MAGNRQQLEGICQVASGKRRVASGRRVSKSFHGLLIMSRVAWSIENQKLLRRDAAEMRIRIIINNCGLASWPTSLRGSGHVVSAEKKHLPAGKVPAKLQAMGAGSGIQFNSDSESDSDSVTD